MAGNPSVHLIFFRTKIAYKLHDNVAYLNYVWQFCVAKLIVMISKEEVETFLNSFLAKLDVFSIIFRDERDKNTATLAELNITPAMRIDIIKKIAVDDYSAGPIIDTLNNYGEMWVFGKDHKGQEIYIKISMGRPNSSTICISFHIAEHPMFFPLKEKK